MPNITFGTGIDVTGLVPDQELEFDITSGVKQTTDQQQRLLLVGQGLHTPPSGAVAVNTPTDVFRETDSEGFFGAGSQLDMMCKAAFKAYPLARITAMSLAEGGGAVAASETLTIAANANAAGAWILQFGAQAPILVAVNSGDTPTVQAAAIAAAVNAVATCPVSAAAALGVVTFTAKGFGPYGNFILVQATPSLNFASTGVLSNGSGYLSGGTTDPTTLAAALAVTAAKRYHKVVNGISSSVGGTAGQTFVEAQSAPTIGLGEIAVQGSVDVLSACTTIAAAMNSARTMLYALRASPSCPWEIAAGCAAVMTSEPSATRPLNTLVVAGIAPPPITSRYIRSELQALLAGGVTPLAVNSSGQVYIVRAISTRVLNAQGGSDLTQLDITTIQGFDAVRDAVVAMFQAKYPRNRWADSDPDGLLPTDVATPAKVTQDLLDTMRVLEGQGIVQGVDTLANQIVVNRVGTQCQFSLPSNIIPGLHRILGKSVLIRTS